MITVAPFHPAHLVELRTQPRQPKNMVMFTDPDIGQALAQGKSYTVFDSDGVVQACMGMDEQWPGRALCWALLSADLRHLMLPISVRARRVFDESGYRRLEAYVDPTFAEAIRWVELLGFKREGLMKKFTPEGDDQLLYARTR